MDFETTERTIWRSNCLNRLTRRAKNVDEKDVKLVSKIATRAGNRFKLDWTIRNWHAVGETCGHFIVLFDSYTVRSSFRFCRFIMSCKRRLITWLMSHMIVRAQYVMIFFFGFFILGNFLFQIHMTKAAIDETCFIAIHYIQQKVRFERSEIFQTNFCTAFLESHQTQQSVRGWF